MKNDIYYYLEKDEYKSSWLDSVFNSRFIPAKSLDELQGMVRDSKDSPVNLACGLTATEVITTVVRQNPDVLFNVFHLSDEWYELQLARELYESDNVQRIFRVYYIPPPFKLIVNTMVFFPVCLAALMMETLRTCIAAQSGRHSLAKQYFSTVRYALGFIRHTLRGSFFLWSDRVSRKLVFLAPGPNEFFYRGKLQALEGCGAQEMPPKKYECSFAGHDHNLYRKNAIPLIKKLDHAFVHTTDDWSLFSKKSLTEEEYALSILQSKAVCCAIGHVNAETFRLYEVLEGGAAPLGITHSVYQPYDYYKMFLGVSMMPKSTFTFRGAINLWTKKQQCVEQHQQVMHETYRDHVAKVRVEFLNAAKRERGRPLAVGDQTQITPSSFSA
ncbi:hypothetical protein [Pontiella sp.]|uniref:hypothetical protein n=1 Tax=Pontiella sp. TaxID=2837462 RepID=UPI0035644FCF